MTFTPDLIPLPILKFTAQRDSKEALALFGQFAVASLSPKELAEYLVRVAEDTTFAQVVKPALLELADRNEFDGWLTVMNHFKEHHKKLSASALNTSIKGSGWVEVWLEKLRKPSSALNETQLHALRAFTQNTKAKALTEKEAKNNARQYLSKLADVSKVLKKAGAKNEWDFWWKTWGLPLVLTESHLKPKYGTAFDGLFEKRSQTPIEQRELLDDLAHALNKSQTYIDAVELRGARVFWPKLADSLHPEAWATWWEHFDHIDTPSNSSRSLKESVAREWVEGPWPDKRAWMERTLLQEKHAATQKKTTQKLSAL
jgi:hypothetical protein